MPGYESNTAARALNLHRKTFDNLLSRFHLAPGRGTQGKRRLFTIAELLNVDLAAALWRLGIPASRLGVLVTELIQHGEVGLAAGLIIRADSDMLRRDLAARLMSASETVVVRRRGRPPAR